MKKLWSKSMLKLKNKFFSNTLKVLGVCSACFMFEACYGTPQADYPDTKLLDVDVSGTLKTEKGNLPSNIQVMLVDGKFGDTISTFSDENGHFLFPNVQYSENTFQLLIKEIGQTKNVADFKISEQDLLANQKVVDVTIKKE